MHFFFFLPPSASDMSKWGWRRETAFPLLFLLSECWGWVIWCLDEWFLPGYNLLTCYYNFRVCRVREKASLFHKEELKCVFRLSSKFLSSSSRRSGWASKTLKEWLDNWDKLQVWLSLFKPRRGCVSRSALLRMLKAAGSAGGIMAEAPASPKRDDFDGIHFQWQQKSRSWDGVSRWGAWRRYWWPTGEEQCSKIVGF